MQGSEHKFLAQGRKGFLLVAACLVVLRVFFGLLSVPESVAPVLSVLSTVLFLGLPIFGIFLAARSRWDAKTALTFLSIGAVVHLSGALYLSTVLREGGFGPLLVDCAVQAAIGFWTLGLGALIGTSIRDPNMVVPLAVFLAGLDMFLVFSPVAPTNRLVKQNPAFFKSLAVEVPAAKVFTEGPATVGVSPQAYVGPADLLFMAVFFVLIAKHQMKLRETFLWLAPVMVAYLLLVLSPLKLSMLPALVPIGITVLLVNWKSFKFSSQEKAMVAGVTVVSLLLAAIGLVQHFKENRPGLRPVPSRPEIAPKPER